MVSGQIVARNSLWLIAQSLLMSVVSVVVVALVARHLGPTDYGRLVLFLSVVALLAPFINLGLRQYMVRQIAGQPQRTGELVGELVPLRMMLAALTLVVAALVYLMLPAATTLSWILLLGIAAQLIINSMTGSLIDTLYGLEQMRLVATANLVSGLFVQTGLAGAALLELPLDYFVMVYVVGNGLLWWRLRAAIGDRFVGLHWYRAAANMLVHLRGCWKFGVPVILESVRVRTAPVVVGGMLGAAPLGQYGAPTVLLEKLDMILDGIVTALFPRAVSLFHSDPAEMKRLVRSVSRFLLMIASAISIGALFTGEALIRFIFGNAFTEAGTLFVIMAFGLPFSFLYWVMFYVLNATGNQHLVAVLSAIGTGSGLALLALLVGLWGITGVALAYPLSYLFLYAISLRAYRRQLGSLLKAQDYIKIALANAAMALVLWLAADINVLLQIALGAAVFFVAALVLRLMSVAELLTLIRRQPAT